MSANSVCFALNGSGIESAQVQVFDSGMTSPNALSWNLLDQNNLRAANGVYLYAIRVRGFNGDVISKVSKFVVLN